MLAFNNIKTKLGGRVRLILSGAAPLAKPTQEFLSCAMCAPVLQGYGLTETCAASSIAEPFRWDTIGTVGAPMPGEDMRQVDCRALTVMLHIRCCCLSQLHCSPIVTFRPHDVCISTAATVLAVDSSGLTFPDSGCAHQSCVLPAAGVEIRLEAVPEMGYDPAAEPPTGEVCIRGPGLFSGYYKQPELTKECMGEHTALMI
jgi:long-subunit acyl-CoA synthetase (AMP-forming)